MNGLTSVNQFFHLLNRDGKVYFVILFLFIFVVLELELRATHLLGRWFTTWATPALFCVGYFQDTVLQTIYPAGWLWNLILLISASGVARISGVSHQHPATLFILE
jgi:hypothetical protein